MLIEDMERLERTTFSMVSQALTDYASQASQIFSEEIDQPQDIAEDVTREAIEFMGLPQMHMRLYGKVDIKKAVYVFLPQAYPVALMLDAKAEKPSGSGTATIQMSQTSMRVRMFRKKIALDEPGRLPTHINRDGRSLYVVTVFAKYIYDTIGNSHKLRLIRAACLPNGLLQNIYNPSEYDTIWRVGRNAPTLGEDFRVRISFADLSSKASWRVRDIHIPTRAV
ncbi:MAG: BglI family type II restriction endonuclease [Chloroflexi bacterium]|nr:BglI family type II restriction endonuclease [Chloroflexota bacterium]MCY3582261.1 BglI family type II restriction endonuclease [Chloroflexota bacterium]MCY3717155.1 BglI family type II restriction endonuclease [Chloroflexota bacterium]MDE2651722.1 BglI family type II restriction endonuclease [Chloroflexota bacterium]MXX51002.1 type II restriction endonuclease [Chloroflexota bacterium]